MHCEKKITNDIYWVGGNDRRLELFENVYPIPYGISYNSYLIKDEKNILADTVDRAVSDVFLENISYLLGGAALDYVIINHTEPDHLATLERLIQSYPEVKIVCNAKTLAMINQFFNFDANSRAHIVAEGDEFTTGRHVFTFVNAPMVHWPEVMVTYDKTDKILFSADAFGTFGALNGNIFADEMYTDAESEWTDEARRYYTNIVGKYGVQTGALLKKAAGLDIKMICPLHGPVIRKNLEFYIEKYKLWSSYTPEQKGVLIAYGSIYGNTENAANILASLLSDKGIKNIKIYDVSKTHASYIVADAFKYSNLVFMSATYNAGIFTPMENLLNDIATHGLKGRTVAFAQNGSWAAAATNLMKAILSKLKDITVLDETVSVKSAVKDEQYQSLIALAEAIAKSIKE